MNKVHQCKAGKPIDDARVSQYTAMCHHMVRQFLPALALFEASMAYEDLINQCKLEVFMCLKNSFDPVLAMTSTIKDPELRAAQIAKKLADPEAALVQAEKNMVYGRLENYLRRTRHRYNPDTLLGRDVKPFRCPSCGHSNRFSKKALKNGGKVVVPPKCPVDGIQMREEQDMSGCSVSLDMIMEGINREEDNNLFVSPQPIKNASADEDRNALIDIMDEFGPEAAKEVFESMGKDRREAITTLLVGRPSEIPTTFSDNSGDSSECAEESATSE